jgi:hypothetical protein
MTVPAGSLEAPVGSTGDRERFTVRSWMAAFAQLAGLCAFAVAGPLFSVLEAGTTFFVVHGITGWSLVGFAAAWLVVPPAILTVLVGTVGAFSPGMARLALGVITGALAGVAVMGVLAGVDRMGPWVWAVGVVVTTCLWAFAYRRYPRLRSALTVTVVAPVVFAVGFLGAGPIRGLVAAEESGAIGAGRSTTPLVKVVLDEFALAVMLTPDGRLNDELFPNMARLAATSTWYPQTTSIAPVTHVAMPSLLTGRLPDARLAPSHLLWPDNLFSLLGGGGPVVAREFWTGMCPPSVCDTAPGGVAAGNAWRDSVIVAVNAGVPAPVARRMVPELGGAWADLGRAGEGGQPPGPGFDDLDEVRGLLPIEFAERVEAEARTSGSQSDEPGLVVESFLDEVSGVVANGGANRLFGYLHLKLPHSPFRFLPDGRTYPSEPESRWFETFMWVGADPAGEVVTRQRYVLQAQYADAVVGEVLDTLGDLGVLDEAMVVVTSDHGVSFLPGGNRRGRDAWGSPDPAGELAEAVPVPLFIKYPGQRTGEVDRREVRLVDVVPTIVDVLDVEVPPGWVVDGVSLLGAPVPHRPVWFGEEVLGEMPDPVLGAGRYWEVLGGRAMGGEPWAIGPYADLVGQQVGEVAGVLPEGGTVRLEGPGRYDDVDPGAQLLPVLVTAAVDGPASGTWVTVLLDGQVAGLGPVYVSASGETVVDIMVNPVDLSAGDNQLVFATVADGKVRDWLVPP